jgi:hypothetical protein
MPRRLFPAKTSVLLIILATIAALIWLLKLKSSTQPKIASFAQCVQLAQSQIQAGPPITCISPNGQVFYQETPQVTNPPVPTLIPATPTPATMSASISLTTDPLTGTHQFTDTANQFSLNIPSLWTPKTAVLSTDPPLTLTTQQNEFVAGIIITPLSWPQDEASSQLSNPTTYRYGNWQGTISTAPGSVPTEVIILTPIASASPGLRLTWARTDPDTNPFTPSQHLHPILNAVKALP